jgi:hypothetical protein
MLSTSAFLISGCGGGPGDTPEMGTVTGTVKMDGKPLKKALITFIPLDHEKARQSVGTTDENGDYELKYSLRETGAMLGKHKVTISTAGLSENEYSENSGGGEKVPARYNVNSELTAIVKPGTQTIDFLDLTSEGEIIEVDDSEQSDSQASGAY